MVMVQRIKDYSMKRNLMVALFTTLLATSHLGLADTCPDLSHTTGCTSLTMGSVCQGWGIQQGTITNNSRFLQVLTRSAFPYTVTCQYDAGRLSLVKLQQAIPASPYLWSIQNIAGMRFNVCVASRQECAFTLIG